MNDDKGWEVANSTLKMPLLRGRGQCKKYRKSSHTCNSIKSHGPRAPDRNHIVQSRQQTQRDKRCDETPIEGRQ